ncbi:hypothetical protein Ancab_014922, partial [Ancistrocladus abbreviatus]
DEKTLEVHLKYERMADFCYDCGYLGHKCDKCGWEMVDGFSVDLKAIDMFDKYARFLPVAVVLRSA